jgi:hypothetical protein
MNLPIVAPVPGGPPLDGTTLMLGERLDWLNRLSHQAKAEADRLSTEYMDRVHRGDVAHHDPRYRRDL